MPATRRARLRRETIRDITATALDHLRAHGAADLSLRAIARDLGMSPAGLYRYFDGRDALLTRLITDSYHDLADHVLVASGSDDGALPDAGERPAPPPFAVAGDAPAVDRLRAAARAYRAWARTHPNQFALLFGDPIPGYEAPPSGETTQASSRVGAALGRPIVELARAGALTPLPHSDDPAVVAAMGALAAFVPADPEVAATLLLGWARLHGVVALELNGQFDFLFGDDAAPLYEATIDTVADEITGSRA